MVPKELGLLQYHAPYWFNALLCHNIKEKYKIWIGKDVTKTLLILRQDSKKLEKFLGKWNGETKADSWFKLSSSITLTHLPPSPVLVHALK